MNMVLGSRGNRVRRSLTFVLTALIVCALASGMAAAQRLVITSDAQPPPHNAGNMYTAIIANFVEKTPGLSMDDVEIRFAQFPEQVITATAAGLAPDIVMTSYPRVLELSRLGMLTPLPPRLVAEGLLESFYPSAREAVTINGQVYGIPQTMNVWAPVYNIDMFLEVGLPLPFQGWTWDDWMNSARRISRDTSGDGVPNVWGTTDNGHNRFFHSYFASEGGWYFDNDLREWGGTTDETIRALERAASWYDMQIMPRPSQRAPNQRGTDFYAGNVSAMLYDHSGALAQLRDLQFQWNIADNPVSVETGKGLSSWSFNSAVLHSDARNRDLAEAFLRYLASEEAQQFIPDYDYISTHRAAALRFLDPESPQDEAAWLRAAETAIFVDYSLVTGAGLPAVILRIQNGEVDPRTAMTEAAPNALAALRDLRPGN